jgi:hypothetical protein
MLSTYCSVHATFRHYVSNLQVHNNWLKTQQVTLSSHASQEVKTCVEIALRCVEADRANRPSIAEIVDELDKIDTGNRSITDEVLSHFFCSFHL